MGRLGTVLLAEDRQDDVLLIQKAIERAGFQNPISVVPDGRETINYLKGGHFMQIVKHSLFRFC